MGEARRKRELLMKEFPEEIKNASSVDGSESDRLFFEDNPGRNYRLRLATHRETLQQGITNFFH
jgi:hypothetical protein